MLTLGRDQGLGVTRLQSVNQHWRMSHATVHCPANTGLGKNVAANTLYTIPSYSTDILGEQTF